MKRYIKSDAQLLDVEVLNEALNILRTHKDFISDEWEWVDSATDIYNGEVKYIFQLPTNIQNIIIEEAREDIAMLSDFTEEERADTLYSFQNTSIKDIIFIRDYIEDDPSPTLSCLYLLGKYVKLYKSDKMWM